jgi:hypothetical protein
MNNSKSNVIFSQFPIKIIVAASPPPSAHNRRHSTTMAATPPIAATTVAPRKPTIKVVDRKYDSEGKVTNWSVDWPEAKELESMVVNGFVDGMTPAQVREKYPHFSSFAYKPFQGGLTNIRKKHNREVAARAFYHANGAMCESCSSLFPCIMLFVQDII